MSGDDRSKGEPACCRDDMTAQIVRIAEEAARRKN
jgi:hypothetical protein